MHRIDDNTYIDDTLVTCVEYQLFIDEMYRRGKFIQPDYWTSHQFQNGQARNPVVGVRLTDASSFCNWLTKQDVEGQRYRLPTEEEVNDYPVKPNLYSLPLGYWINSINEQFHFIGNKGGSFNPREINRKLFVKKTLARAINLDRSASRRRYSGSDYKSEKAFDRVLAVYLFRALNRAFAVNLDRGMKLDENLDFALNFVLDRALRLENIHNHNRAIDIALIHALSYALGLVHDGALANDIELAFDIYTDLYTIQERIARRSPPFEGIRLVKYR